MKVYAIAARRYREAGWAGVLPLPPGRKFGPPKGYTGNDGQDPDDARISEWIDTRADSNVGLRLPAGVVGYDADLYKAEGQQTHAALEARCGPLPPTWVSTSRKDGSGIRLYRVPAGVKLGGAFGGIEIIQRHHRYAVAPPSLHPEGRLYFWVSPAGELAAEVPRPDELPELPPAWLAALAEPSSNGHARRPRGCDWAPAVERAFTKAVADMRAGSRHDAALAGAMALERLRTLGHPGAADALGALGDLFRSAIGDRATEAEAEAEWERMLAGAQTKVAETPSTAPPWDDAGGEVVPSPRDPLAVARFVVDAHHRADDQALTLRHWRGAFHRWQGTHWSELEEAAVRSDLYRVLGRANWVNDKGLAEPWQPSRRKVADVLDALRALVHLPETIEPPAWLEGAAGPPAGELVAVKNGLLHVPTRRLQPHQARFFGQVSVPFDFDPAAPATPPRWGAFLDELWPGDTESIDALAQFFGYVLAGDTSLQKILLLVGPTRAGKGVILRVLQALLGRRHVAAPTLASLGQNFGLSPLIGKPLATITDARLGGSNVHAVVERLLSISGEDALTIDRKYREPWTGKLGTRFVIVSNELPRFGDSSRAIARRFVILTFTRSFLGNENPRLTAELLTELPGILNWSLAGLERLRAQGHFTEPATSKEAIVALEDLASPVWAFVRDQCKVEPEGRVTVEDIYRAWRQWCSDNGHDRPGSAQNFGRNLRAAVPGLRIIRPREGDERFRLYEGIRLQ